MLTAWTDDTIQDMSGVSLQIINTQKYTNTRKTKPLPTM